MNIKFASTVLAVGSLLVPLMGHAADASDPTGKATYTSTAKTEVKDSWITTKIKAEFVKDKQVSAMRVKVETDDKGVVVLSGKAKSQAEIDRAVTIARGVKGVTEVTNNIQIATN